MCERFSTGAEPVNATSAGLIVLVALYSLFVWFRSWHRDGGQLALSVLALATGVGAVGFHVIARPPFALAEAAPLMLFLLVAFVLILRRMFRAGGLVTLLVLALVLMVHLALTLAGGAADMGESARFLTLLAALYLMAGGLVIKARLGMNADRGLTGMAAARSDALHFPRLRAGYGLVVVGIIFALGLAAKSMDMPLCNRFAIGSHFIWHLAVAIVVWRVLMIALHYPTAPEVKARLDAGR